MEKIVGFPRFGKYSDIIKEFINDLGIKVAPTPPITKRTIELGAKHSPEMQCIPFKFNLGNFIEILEKTQKKNKKIILMHYKTCGKCRFHAYYVTQKQILEDLGYKFEMVVLSWTHPFKIIREIRQINPDCSYIRIIKGFFKTYRRIKEVDKQDYSGDIKIGVFGEIFTCLEPSCNIDIINKLKKMGCYVENSLSLNYFLKSRLDIFSKIKEKKEAKRLFPEKIGGHAFHSITSMIDFCRRNFDGCLFLRPLTCSPEVHVEPIIQKLSKQYKLPLLILNFDENVSEQNLNTRVETFIDTLRMKNAGRIRY